MHLVQMRQQYMAGQLPTGSAQPAPIAITLSANTCTRVYLACAADLAVFVFQSRLAACVALCAFVDCVGKGNKLYD